MHKIIVFLLLAHCGGDALAQCTSGDCKNGTGTFIFSNGDKYDGQWKDGKKEGRGEYWWANGITYIGDFTNDNAIGYGLIIYKDKSWFAGTVINSIPSENGYFHHADGTIDNTKSFGMYSTYGRISGDTKNGSGGLIDSNGVYIGEWVNGNASGQGRFYWKSSGAYYIGGWVNGVYEGSGTYVFGDGTSFIGQFHNGQMVTGTYYLKNGSVDYAQNGNRSTPSDNNNKDNSNPNANNQSIKTDGSFKGNLNFLLNDLPNSLKTVEGESLGTGYKTKLGLPGGMDCYVSDYPGVPVSEICRFYEGTDLAAARAKYNELL